MGAARVLSLALMVACVSGGASLAQSAATGSPVAPAVGVRARDVIDQAVSEVNVDNATLSHVIDYLRNETGANLVVDWRTLETAGVSKDTPITLQVRNVSVRKLLKLAFDQASPSTPLSITVDQNVIEVTTQEEEDRRLVTCVYPIADLLILPENIAPPTLSLNSASQQGQAGGGGGSTLFQQNSNTNTMTTAAQIGDQLATIIRNTVRPNVWRENGGNSSIQFFMGQLVVTAPVSVQEAIGGGPMLDRQEVFAN